MKTRNWKQVIDIAMSLVLLFLMAYQATGDLCHELLGAAMLVLFIIHNILNIRWYGKLVKAKYSLIRGLWTLINLATLIAILLTGYSGIAISKKLFTFLTLPTGTFSARSIHLAGSYWSFVLMSCHLGLHWGMVTAVLGKKLPQHTAGLTSWRCGNSVSLNG